MRTVRVPLGFLAQGRRQLDEQASRYLSKVHRLRVGDTFVAFDPAAGLEARGRVVEQSREATVVDLGAPRRGTTLPARRTLLVQAVGKSDKLDAVVRDATELGASRIAPVVTERSVARKQSQAALARWNRIAIEAARQCGRSDAPTIDEVTPFERALDTVVRSWLNRGGQGWLLDPQGDVPLPDALAALAPGAPIAILIGPEGGFSQAERDAASTLGLTRVSLGPLVLRTETACPAILGALLAV